MRARSIKLHNVICYERILIVSAHSRDSCTMGAIPFAYARSWRGFRHFLLIYTTAADSLGAFVMHRNQLLNKPGFIVCIRKSYQSRQNLAS